MDFLYNSNIVVAISFTLFFAVLLYYGVHKMLLKALDDRADRIRHELDEARRLREEAQATFAEFERKQNEVSTQADEIVEHAKEEAQKAAEKAKADLTASIERRLKAADEQIGLAEANAIKEVRDKAASIAVAAAAEAIRAKMSDQKSDALIDEAIGAVGDRLH